MFVPNVFSFATEGRLFRYGSIRRVRGKGRQSRSPLSTGGTRRATARRLCATFLPHRVAAHLDPVRVVDQAVENAVGYGRIADLLVPPRDR